MALEHWNTERRMARSQEQTMNLSDMAEGYAKQVDAAYTGPMAAAVRMEVKKCADAAVDLDGPEQENALNALLKALAPYRQIFADVPEDEGERAAFALALAKREKSLQ